MAKEKRENRFEKTFLQSDSLTGGMEIWVDTQTGVSLSLERLLRRYDAAAGPRRQAGRHDGTTLNAKKTAETANRSVSGLF